MAMLAVLAGAWLLLQPAALADDDDVQDMTDLCAGLTDKKLERCETQRREKVAKLREKTTPFQPSLIHADLGALDANNPFDTDRFYLGTVSTSVPQFDAVINEVIRVQATVKLTRYLGELYAAGETEKAAQYAGPTLIALIELKDTKENIMARLQELQGVDPKSLLSPEALKNPSELLKAGQATLQLGRITAQVPTIFADVPGAIASLKPIIGDGAFEAIVDQATKAIKARLQGQQ